MAKDYKHIAIAYAEDCVSGKKVAGKEIVAACKRFLEDIKRDDLELHTREPDFVIGIIEGTLVHKQGETLDGTSLVGTPLILQPWQVFIVYNLLGLYYKGTKERKYKEAFIMLGRKNGKTTLIASLAWGISLLERRSGSSMYIVAGSQKQAQQSFDFIDYNLKHMGARDTFRVLSNNAEHSIYRDFGGAEGSIRIEALASNPDAQDSLTAILRLQMKCTASKNRANTTDSKKL